MGRVVLDRYFAVTLTVPAHTDRAAPLDVVVPIDNLVLVGFTLTIPDGHVGVTGFALEFAGKRIVPWDDPDAWIIGNDEIVPFAVGIEVGTELVIRMFNDGFYDHRFFLRLHVQYLPDVQQDAGGADAIVIPFGATA